MQGKPITAVVIGAGVGGVAIAARLAKAGFKVTVFEKNNFTGGRCSQTHHEGYRFDQGPSLLLLPELYRETFSDLGTSLEAEGIDLLKCEPNYSVHLDGGKSLELSTDLCRMRQEIEYWEGKNGFGRYLAFLQEARRHYDGSVTHVLKRNFSSLWDLFRPSFFLAGLVLHPFESMYSRASRYFRSEELRRVLTFSSLYLGMSPFEAPGTYSLLHYSETAEGIWYPKGGFHKIVSCLVRIGERYGVDYRLSAPVTSIDLLSSTTSGCPRRVGGVTLATGEHILADVVIVNADLVYAYGNLLPPSERSQSYSKRPTSCSSISFYWALDRQIPELTTHNIFLSEPYKASFGEIFETKRVPSNPSFYVHVPSRIDSSAAPEGRDVAIVLVPVSHLGTSPISQDNPHEPDWDEVILSIKSKVLQTIVLRTGCCEGNIKELENSISHETVNTPPIWASRFNLDRGSILGLDYSFFNVLSFRPPTKHRTLGGLFFVGSSTHPGGGVPVCLAGAKITSEQILRSYDRDMPWNPRSSHNCDGRGDDSSPVKRNIAIRIISVFNASSSLIRGMLVAILTVALVHSIVKYKGLRTDHISELIVQTH